MDEEISALFHDAIDSFPEQYQEPARSWLITREAAFNVIDDLEKNGVSGLVPDDDD